MNEWGFHDWGFVGGRRRYNRQRKNAKQTRRVEVLLSTSKFRLEGKPYPWGLQAALAKLFGVSKATICRDMRAIRDADKGALLK